MDECLDFGVDPGVLLADDDGNADEAERIAKAARFEAKFHQALAEEADGNLESAIACYREVLAIEPDNPGVMSNYGSCLRRSGNLEAGLKVRWRRPPPPATARHRPPPPATVATVRRPTNRTTAHGLTDHPPLLHACHHHRQVLARATKLLGSGTSGPDRNPHSVTIWGTYGMYFFNIKIIKLYLIRPMDSKRRLPPALPLLINITNPTFHNLPHHRLPVHIYALTHPTLPTSYLPQQTLYKKRAGTQRRPRRSTRRWRVLRPTLRR